MRVFRTKLFNKGAKNFQLPDTALFAVAREVFEGRYEANLGGGVIKKRIAINGKGKRGGIRSIIFFKVGSHIFFADTWSKNDTPKSGKEIDDAQLYAYRLLAETLLNLNDKQLIEMIAKNLLTEVKECEDTDE
ncbi:type II toxin-antitoxin system RelE/ParE family toxin [Pluralibacter gergoviae]|uniref:Type II toxin-antitoxin system RelE/ParE family toxin n=1 Tax=Pluralibacter gergoviae TaxID=61647 RepID=A0AAW8HM47_PLUGE|nr:type II toxin-antitoxin system RelE/ParE family toxin [Pluralibacter gergoviae]AVR02862.1 addiction module toxin RelE [Pluralibacter gergoviae]KJM66012.1 hypothetical protein SS31_03955 [Pluralibacter gergoviae]KMK05146.1 hypothetical protein ABW08_07600 [Pluralibacter gergoviae]KMK29332.1 hypothetical protein ABW11_05200 [Pluralibacter gergoviae]MDQ2309287.1 type II toxin-antitoxin system RelE/ParE family toxin [Pluralibacter gergoviae]